VIIIPPIKSKPPFKETNIADVASCLKYKGKPKSLDEMNAATQKGVKDKPPLNPT